MPPSLLTEIVRSAENGSLFLAFVSLTALTTTFVIANLNLTLTAKFLIFILIVVLYLSFCAAFYLRRKHRMLVEPEIAAAASEAVFNEEVEAKLFALEEAHQFFGASLKFADMFRLVASRLNEIIPFATCVLFVVGDEKTILKAQFAVGKNKSEFTDLKVKTGSGLAGKSLQSGETRIDEQLSEERKIVSAKALNNLQTGIAAPLFRRAEVFGVLVLYGDAKNQFKQNSLELLAAAAERAAPLFISSQGFENNLANALTDALTALPNERAFYLVLENQIAEAQRFQGVRTLTVVTIDIVNFDELNCQYGHATGDRVLGFAAETIRAQLRRMDFLARSTGDEFLAVLPTASESVAREITERVRKSFVVNSFRISPAETIHLQLNFGASSFGNDGETAAVLVKHALLKKKLSKTAAGENKILFFPKEFVN